MPFQYILANLLAQVESAAGVLFLDDSGETIDLACSDFSPYDMKILGAYLGITLRQLDRVLGDADLGTARLAHIERASVHLYAVTLSDGYYLVLVQHKPSLPALARRRLEAAAEELERSLFG